jgi:hypothetical protein
VAITEKIVSYTRPELIEEFSVSVDGLRQPPDPGDALIGDGHFLLPVAPGAAESVSGEVLFEKP